VTAVGEMIGRVASIERITHAVAAAAEQQTAASGSIAQSVQHSVQAMRVVAGQIEAVGQEARGTDAAVAEMQSVAGAVSHQIAELRSVMIRIVRHSSDAVTRRDDERIDVELPATLMVNGAAVPVVCLNISRGGVRLKAEQELPDGARGTLRLSGLPDLPGALLTGGHEVGMRFEWEADDAPAELHAWLEQKTAA
jgi:methyl-accepting chemotaxis protein